MTTINDFQQFETRSFSDNLYTGKISINDAEKDEANSLVNIIECNDKSRPKTKEGKDKKQGTFDSISALYEGQELALNTFRSGIFPIKENKANGLKVLTPKQILER